MTVSELIEHLSKMPPDKPVICERGWQDGEHAVNVAGVELLPAVGTPWGGPGREAARAGHPEGCVVIRGTP